MDDAALQKRLTGIERRQYAILALLAGLYVYGAAELVGYWVAGVLGAAVLLVVFISLVVSGRGEETDPLGE